VPAQCGGR